MRRPAFWAGCAVIFGEILGFIIYEQQQSDRNYFGVIALIVGLILAFIGFVICFIHIKTNSGKINQNLEYKKINTQRNQINFKVNDSNLSRKHTNLESRDLKLKSQICKKAGKHTDKSRKYRRYCVCFSAFLFLGMFASIQAEMMQKQQVMQQSDMPEQFTGKVESVEKTSSGFRCYLKTDIADGMMVIVNVYIKDGQKSDVWPWYKTADNDNASLEDLCEHINAGDRLLMKNQPQLFKHATNPGCYDAFNYWRSKNIYYHVSVSDTNDIILLQQGQNKILRWAGQLKRQISEVIFTCLEASDAGMLQALVIGDASEMDSDIRSLYSKQGIAHIFSISALHMSIIGAGLYKLQRRRGIRIRISALTSGGLLLFYALMCGFSVSAVRALVMFFLTLCADCMGRTFDTLSGMMIALISLIVPYPFLLMNFAFWMSFGCVFALCLIAMRRRKLRQIRQNSKKKKDVLEDAIWLYLFNIPILAWFQFSVPLYSWCLNLLVIPCVGILYPIGLIGSLLGCVNLWLGQHILYACHPLLWCMNHLIEITEKLPLSELITGQPPIWLVIAAEAVWVFQILSVRCGGKGDIKINVKNKDDRNANNKNEEDKYIEDIHLSFIHTSNSYKNIVGRYKNKHEKVKGYIGQQHQRQHECVKLRWKVCLWCVYIFILVPVRLPTDELQVHFVDVGQGDCSLLIHPNHSVTLIDGGSTSQDDVGTYVLQKVLRYYGIQMIDRVVLTHMDEDHINGIETLIEQQYPIQSIYISAQDIQNTRFKQLAAKAQAQHISVYSLKQGDKMQWDGVEAECLWPENSSETVPMNNNLNQISTYKKDVNENDCSVVLLMTYQKCRMLFTSDISGECEQKLMNYLDAQYRDVQYHDAQYHDGQYHDTQYHDTQYYDTSSVKESNQINTVESDMNDKQTYDTYKIDILKVAHHGSKYSSTDDFLDYIQPRLAVISCAEKNLYGHPASDTIDRLTKQNTKIYYTMKSGMITMHITENKIEIEQYLQNGAI